MFEYILFESNYHKDQSQILHCCPLQSVSIFSIDGLRDGVIIGGGGRGRSDLLFDKDFFDEVVD